MEAVSSALEKATAILKTLDGKTLTADHLDKIEAELDALGVSELIGGTNVPVPDEENTAGRDKLRDLTNKLNKAADSFNDELERIKRMRTALSLDGLDPVIHAAKRIIQPVYNFTAGLGDFES